MTPRRSFRDSGPTRARLAVGVSLLLGGSTALLLLAGATPQADSPAAAVAAIRRVLDDQAVAWNRGNLDAFLVGYWNSPGVVFQSGGTKNVGFDAMRDRYRKRYQGEGRAMGRLVFSELEVEVLGSDATAAFARGRYTLTMPDGSMPTGLFTLILRRLPDGWRIIHDHTSAAEPTAPSAPRPVAPG